MQRLAELFLAAALVGLAGCPTGAGTGDPEPDPGPGADGGASPWDADVEPRCAEDPAPWSAGTLAFEEATERWGLSEIGAEGVRLATADLDEDGHPDLLVRRGGVRSDDPGNGDRHTWLLSFSEGRFVDVTEHSGLLAPRNDLMGRLRPAEVVAFADVDNDGDLDVYTGMSTAAPDQSFFETPEVMLNQGEGVFELGPSGSDLRRAGNVSAPAGASFLDYDRDGRVDLFIGEHNYNGPFGVVFQHDRLYAGQGDGDFVDVTPGAGLVTEDWAAIEDLNRGRAHSRSWGTAACDLDDDGWLDLLVPSYGRSPNHLWQGGPERGEDGPGFDNRSVASGYAYDDDLTWQDNQFAMCFCQENPDAEGCDEAGSPAIVCDTPNWSHDQDREPFRLGGNSGTTVCADLDNDQDIDLFTTEIRHWWAGSGSDGSEVLVNETEGGEIRFDRPGDQALGLAIPHGASSWDEGHMTASALDFDQDGWLDLYLGASDYPGNRGHLYRQLSPDEGGPLSFEEVPVEDGVDHWRSHGIAAADFDRDGDLDLAVGHSRARCGSVGECYPTAQVRVFENVVGQDSNWIQLRLVGGEGTNRAAIGARVTLTAGGVTQTREVGGGFGHYGMQNDVVVHFGLGEACEAEVTVRWPDAEGTEETFALGAGWRYRVTQGEPAAVAEEPGG